MTECTICRKTNTLIYKIFINVTHKETGEFNQVRTDKVFTLCNSCLEAYYIEPVIV